jgi:hypothetical protein
MAQKAINVAGGDGTAVPTGFALEEIVARSGAYTNFPATTVTGDLISVTLTPGVWVLNAQATYFNNGATQTNWGYFIGTVAGNNVTGRADGDNTFFGGAVPAAQNFSSGGVSGFIVRPTVTTTYYLKHNATYSAGTPQAVGRLSAIRQV